MGYNERKLEFLQLLSELGPTDSISLARAIENSREIVPDIHAVRMALMRYYKQGLLKREKVAGAFKYCLSERGEQRLRWLRDHTQV